MLEFVCVGVGGFVGSCLRFALNKASGHIASFFPPGNLLPLGTLLSNALAGLLIGFFIGLEQNHITFSPKTRLLITTGFMGGLSTFSTFNMETVMLFQSGKHILAAGNIILNLTLSFLFLFLGMACAGFLLKKA